MSTKIYDGFRFKAKNLDEVLFLLKEFSKKAEKEAQIVAKLGVLDDVSAMIDESFLNLTSSFQEEWYKKRSFLALARDKAEEKLKSDERMFNDVSLEIVILAYKKNYLGIT